MPEFRKVFGAAAIFAQALAQNTITIDTSTRLQQIDGFGFSQAFGRARAFEQTPEDTRRQALDLLFSTETGAGFSVLRNRIGSGDGAPGDTILPASPGSPDGEPEYVWDADDRGQVWLTREAMGYGVETIIADAWSAPGFMKTSGDEALPGYLCGTPGNDCETGDWQQAYANFLVRYIEFYATEGLNITHLAPFNEPDWEVSYSQMQISDDAREAISFIPILNEAMLEAGLDGVALMCCDSAGWDAQKMFTAAIVDSDAGQYLDVITGHSYTSQPGDPIDTTELPKWNTEAGPDVPFITTWHDSGAQNEGFTWAVKIAEAISESELSAYLFWQGFQLQNPESAMHLIDALDGVTPTPSGIYWAFAMWSRHIRPGAQRVSVEDEVEDLLSAAVVNADGSVVVVLTNSASQDREVMVRFEGAQQDGVVGWVTDNERKFDEVPLMASEGIVVVDVPRFSVVTIKILP